MESRRTTLHLLFAFVLAFTLATSEVSATDNINDDGNITWADFPAGEEYLTPDEYDEGEPPLPAMWDMMYGWINTISPGELPYAEIGSLFSGGGMDMTSVQGLVMDNLASVFAGFAVCIAIGFLFLLIFPIVCCCFCCCRMCGNCGGKMHQKETSSLKCKKFVFLALLLTTTFFLGFGVACGYFVNERTEDVLLGLEDNIVNTIDDMLKFVNNTVQELTFVALDQTVWLIGQVMNDFADVGGVLGTAIYDSAAVNIQPAVDAMITVVDNIENTKTDLEELQTLSAALKTDYDAFCAALDVFKTTVNSMYADAGCTGATCPNPGRPKPTNMKCVAPIPKYDTVTNGETFPDVEVAAAIVSLDNILADDPQAEAEAGADQFERIPQRVQNASDAAIAAINGTFTPFISQIEGALAPLTSQLNGMVGGVQGIKDGISGASQLLAEYDIYRTYAMYGLHGVVVLVVLFNVIGVVFGLTNCIANPTPTERSALSNCGGLFLMASAGFCFIFASFYMLLTVFPFLIGAPINKFICQPLLSGALLEATIDNPNGFMGSQGYYLSETLFNDGSIEFTVSGALDDCDNGATPYNAFHLQSFFDISQYTNFDQYFDDTQFDGLTNDIDLTGIEIMSNDTIDSLNAFKDAPLDSIDWTSYEAELNKDILHATYGEDITSLADAIDSYVITNSIADPYASSLRNTANDVRSYQLTNIMPMVNQRNNVKAAVLAYQANSGNIDASVDDAILKGNDADDYFATDSIANIIDAEVDNYKIRLKNYIQQFSSYVNKSIDQDIGKCEPVANVIDNIFNLICRDFLDPFNAFWFINGWYVFFFMPSIIFGVKLAKFFRKMKTADTYRDDTMEMKGYPDYGQGAPFHNKVAAGPV